MRSQRAGRSRSLTTVAVIAIAGLAASGTSALAAAGHARRHERSGRGRHHVRRGAGSFTAVVFASGAAITHPGPHGQTAVSNPDDITALHGRIFVAFQNGVGPQGQPSPTGNSDSTVVEFDRHGRVVDQWDITGKCDGLTADPGTGRLIATVNEDLNSSLYEIDPHRGGSVVHYTYAERLPSNGGTDAISIDHGMILISASAPGTTGAAPPQPSYPAVYRVRLDRASALASVEPLFHDEDPATIVNRDGQFGMTVALALTDPDSNEVVPEYATRFAGDFMLTSQGDKQQIFVHGAGTAHPSLSVLNLSDSVDDTVWPAGRGGAIFATDSTHDTVNEITGPFTRGAVFVVDTPCGANDAPSTCPGPGFPANFLGQLNPDTGTITAVNVGGAAFDPQGGMLFLP